MELASFIVFNTIYAPPHGRNSMNFPKERDYIYRPEAEFAPNLEYFNSIPNMGLGEKLFGVLKCSAALLDKYLDILIRKTNFDPDAYYGHIPMKQQVLLEAVEQINQLGRNLSNIIYR